MMFRLLTPSLLILCFAVGIFVGKNFSISPTIYKQETRYYPEYIPYPVIDKDKNCKCYES
jgi:hypothetical protein